MIERVVASILDESQWLAASMTLALVGVALVLGRRRGEPVSGRRRAMVALNLFFGVVVGTMALGHLLAVTVELASGTLRGSAVPLYLIGLALAAPSWCLIGFALRLSAGRVASDRGSLAFNAWLVVTLVALGLHNLPLALPGLLNIGYRLHARRAVGRAILGTALVVQLALFVGALVFAASGRTFEEFRGSG